MKELTIQAERAGQPWVSPVLRDPGTIIRTVDCRPHGRRGTMSYVEISSLLYIKDVLRAISSEPNVVYSTFNVFDEFRASGIVVRKNAPVCRAVFSNMGFCRRCPMSQTSGEPEATKWQIVFSGKTSSRKFLAELRRKGIRAAVIEYGNPTNNGSLTFEQEQALKISHEKGYFRFPRETSLKEISKVLGISPSTLDEILRRAQAKVVAEHVGKSHRTPRR